MTQKNSGAALPVSVIVLTYNASWERVRATLNSAILQKDIDFELIVTDDGSRENHFEKIKDFFSRHSFTNYKLVAHDENLGTVKNYLDAAKKSSGKYIRGIGQGDMFFDEHALRDSYNYMAENNCVLMGSKAVYFKALSNPVKIIQANRSPQDIQAYKNPDSLRQKYLIDNDILLGACVMFERETLIKYLSEVADWKGDGIFLLEDSIMRLMIFDKLNISYFERNTVYYEHGIGVSTSLQSMNNLSGTRQISNRTIHDVILMDKMLLERCEKYPSEFSEKLSRVLNGRKNFHERESAKQALKNKLGVFAFPLMAANRFRIYVKKILSRSPQQDNFIKTDINTSPDFANLCINRE